MKQVGSMDGGSAAAGERIQRRQAGGGIAQSRRPRRVAAAIGLAAALAALGYVDPAQACSCDERAVNQLQLGEGRIPANAGGIVWWFGRGQQFEYEELETEQAALGRLQSMLTLQRWNGAAFQVVANHVEKLAQKAYLIRPDVPWSAGERYQLSIDAGEKYGDPETRSRSVELEIELPLEETQEMSPLASSEAQYGRVPFMVGDGSCGIGREAVYVDVDFGAPESGQDWPRELLLYTTYVDDRIWSHLATACSVTEPGASWFSRTGNRLVAACDRNAAAVEGLSEGSHTVRMEARLAGTDVAFSTSTASVELRCAPATAAGAQTTDETLPADGCSLSPAQPRSGQGRAGLGLLALALAAATRKRWATGARVLKLQRGHPGVGH
ncbi:MAG: hypothetical protein ABI895_33615 [Deltaproteobacteria bacterium]